MCVCLQFREAQTSAHNQVLKVISSYLIRWVGPKWTVHEETQMGNMGLTLSKVPATVLLTGTTVLVPLLGTTLYLLGTAWHSLVPPCTALYQSSTYQYRHIRTVLGISGVSTDWYTMIPVMVCTPLEGFSWY